MKRSLKSVLPTLFCLLVLSGAGLRAIYLQQETRKVPISRLVENLERQLAENPRNVQTHINLARLHGMAFALRTEEVPAVVRKDGVEEPWYGYNPKLVPYAGRAVPPGEATDSTKEHLRRSLAHYEAALLIEPDNLLALLGHGWMLEQAGREQDATSKYRRVVELAWPKEKDARVLLPQQRQFSEEAIRYLIPLLNPERDKKEIADLRQKLETLSAVPRAITPIAVPLSDGIPSARIHDPSVRVVFDADGTGLLREWSWISPEVGWLVYDDEGRGEITSALQLFGNVTFWLSWSNGYEALSALDDNMDGEISGIEKRRLAVWRDANRNAKSEPGEVRPLDAHGIDRLSCRFEEGDGVTFAAISSVGIRLHDGTTRPTYDVLLRSSRSLTRAHPAPSINRTILQHRADEHE